MTLKPLRGPDGTRLPLTAQVTAYRGMKDHYTDALRSLRPWMWLVLPFLLWQARRSYIKELEALRKGESNIQQRQTP